MPARWRRAAPFDGRHELQLPQTQASRCSSPWPVAAEDVRNLQHEALDSVKQDVWFTDKHLGRPDKTIVAAQGATARWLLGGQTVHGTVLNH